MTIEIFMIDWIINKIEKISRAIFHWTWRVQTRRKYFKKKGNK
tara:strand:- start:1517 stop:1645 length:129 start_codon:yes stop_codon:yes gene_type:complete